MDTLSTSGTDRRAHHRVTCAPPLLARVIGGGEGQVRDLSAGGLRLEHEGVLRVGAPCLLRVGLTEERFTFRGRVAWSRAIGPAGVGRGRLRCHSGITFQRIPAAAEAMLAQLLAP